MGSHLLPLYAASRSSPTTRLSAYSSTLIRRYTKPSKEGDGPADERAPTTAEEFERVAGEFEKIAEAKARQGLTGQTIEKAHDGTEEAALGESTVKEKYKEPPARG